MTSTESSWPRSRKEKAVVVPRLIFCVSVKNPASSSKMSTPARRRLMRDFKRLQVSYRRLDGPLFRGFYSFSVL